MDPTNDIQCLHKNAFIADMHCDTIGRVLQGDDLTLNGEVGHLDIPKLRAGAVNLEVFACFIAPPQNREEKLSSARKAENLVAKVHELVESNPTDLLLILNSGDIKEIRKTGKIGILIGIEGGYAIENDILKLHSFYHSGVRLLTLTHWNRTDWADASGDSESLYSGLTGLGKQIVREMNSLGMIIDVSHAHDKTFWDVLHISVVPVTASHSCCRALSPHHRNLSDDMLKALAETGGVVGINFAPNFLDAAGRKPIDELRFKLLDKHGISPNWFIYQKTPLEKKQAFEQEFQAKVTAVKAALPPVDQASVADHIEHVIKVTGSADHVGLGSDYDGIEETPQNLEHIGKLSAVTAELNRRGYNESEIKKILGENFLRIFNRVCSPQPANL